MMKVKLEFQYFENCPNHKKLFDNLQKAIEGLDDKIELIKMKLKTMRMQKSLSFVVHQLF